MQLLAYRGPLSATKIVNLARLADTKIIKALLKEGFVTEHLFDYGVKTCRRYAITQRGFDFLKLYGELTSFIYPPPAELKEWM